MAKKRTNDSVVALFSGAGGLSLGFAQAGAPPKVAAEIDPDACETYRTNLAADIWETDLSQPNRKLNARLAQLERPLALVGGPPCQGFSSAGIKNGSDPRNRLIFNYLAILEQLKPRWFLFENVEGLLTSSGGTSLADLVRQFIRLGYRIRLEKVNFASFGLPQARKRVIIVGNNLGLDFTLPPATHSFHAGKHKSGRGLPSAPSLELALAGLGRAASAKGASVSYMSQAPSSYYDELMRIGNTANNVTLHYSLTRSKDREIIRHLKPGQTMKDLPEHLWHDSFKRRANRRVMDGTPTEKRGGAPSGIKRLVANYNSLTITSAATREFVHPSEDRNLTLREAARLQSFPDYFQFSGNASSIAKQIGNAFPPLAASKIAHHLVQLDGMFGGTSANKYGRACGGLIGYALTDSIGMSPALKATKALLDEIREGDAQLDLESLMEKVA
ncbi:MAG TPA: DNA cytosine methyltransferase [Hyphomicrobium sp.]|nr:DNA cytosine methyltransferase [Hyphomicrobium sp.]